MSDPARPLGVAVIGYSFMGKAHSNAWRNVGSFFPDCPAVRQQVLVGRDAGAVKEAAGRYGWAEAATDWTAVIGRDDIDIVDICTPGDTHSEIALAALAAGKHVWSRSRWPTRWPSPSGWWSPRRRPPSAGCAPWWASTTAGCRRSLSPAT